MTQRVPNDRKERLEFLRKMHRLRNEVKGENVKIQNRRFEKLYLHVKKLQNNNQLPVSYTHLTLPTILLV